MRDAFTLLDLIAAELYYRAAMARSKEERDALKGVQHAIEDVLKLHKQELEHIAKARASVTAQTDQNQS